jgi:aspartate-semialdehyde dehydrogenase
MSAVAILHPTTLLGKELRETLDLHATTWRDIRLLSTREDEIGTLTEVAGAAAMVQRYEPESLRGVTTAFFCGPIAQNRPLLQDLPPDALAVLLSFDATVEDGVPVVSGVSPHPIDRGRPLLSPHPAVVLLAHLLHPLAALGLESAVATVIQPASMRDDAGIEELFEQTRQIVAMVSRSPTPVFGAQLSFNLLPTPLPAEPLAGQLAAVLAGAPPVPLQIVQGGIFHGISASVHVRLSGDRGVQALRKALAGNPHLENAEDPKHLGPIDSAASDKVLVGAIRKAPDGGFWLWAVMDNLTRGGALNALEIADAASP